MFEAYGIRVSSEQSAVYTLELTEFECISNKNFFLFSAALAEGFDWQAAAGGDRGAASCARHRQEHKRKQRNSHI